MLRDKEKQHKVNKTNEPKLETIRTQIDSDCIIQQRVNEGKSTYIIRKDYKNFDISFTPEHKKIIVKILGKLNQSNLQNFTHVFESQNNEEVLVSKFDHYFKSLNDIRVSLKNKGEILEEGFILYIIRAVIDVGDVLEDYFCYFPEISLTSIKVCEEDSTSGWHSIKINNPLLYEEFFNNISKFVLEQIFAMPCDLRSNKFIFDAISRKRFLKLNTRNKSAEPLNKLDEFCFQRSKNTVYKLFLSMLALGTLTDEEAFNVNNFELNKLLKEKINNLKYSNCIKGFFTTVLIDMKYDNLPSFSQLKKLYMRTGSLGDKTDMLSLSDRLLGFEGASDIIKSHYEFFKLLYDNSLFGIKINLKDVYENKEDIYDFQIKNMKNIDQTIIDKEILVNHLKVEKKNNTDTDKKNEAIKIDKKILNYNDDIVTEMLSKVKPIIQDKTTQKERQNEAFLLNERIKEIKLNEGYEQIINHQGGKVIDSLLNFLNQPELNPTVRKELEERLLQSIRPTETSGDNDQEITEIPKSTIKETERESKIIKSNDFVLEKPQKQQVQGKPKTSKSPENNEAFNETKFVSFAPSNHNLRSTSHERYIVTANVDGDEQFFEAIRLSPRVSVVTKNKMDRSKFNYGNDDSSNSGTTNSKSLSAKLDHAEGRVNKLSERQKNNHDFDSPRVKAIRRVKKDQTDTKILLTDDKFKLNTVNNQNVSDHKKHYNYYSPSKPDVILENNYLDNNDTPSKPLGYSTNIERDDALNNIMPNNRKDFDTTRIKGIKNNPSTYVISEKKFDYKSIVSTKENKYDLNNQNNENLCQTFVKNSQNQDISLSPQKTPFHLPSRGSSIEPLKRNSPPSSFINNITLLDINNTKNNPKNSSSFITNPKKYSSTKNYYYMSGQFMHRDSQNCKKNQELPEIPYIHSNNEEYNLKSTIKELLVNKNELQINNELKTIVTSKTNKLGIPNQKKEMGYTELFTHFNDRKTSRYNTKPDQYNDHSYYQNNNNGVFMNDRMSSTTNNHKISRSFLRSTEKKN